MMGKKRRASEQIAEAIRTCIRKGGLSTYALGEASSVSPSIISRWLNGERSPTLHTVEKLVTALHLALVRREHER
jgi:transcriptional regulator with XRE-family HTH domain